MITHTREHIGKDIWISNKDVILKLAKDRPWLAQSIKKKNRLDIRDYDRLLMEFGVLLKDGEFCSACKNDKWVVLERDENTRRTDFYVTPEGRCNIVRLLSGEVQPPTLPEDRKNEERLHELEKKIWKGIDASFEAGKALVEIKENGLWKFYKKCTDFEDYVFQKFKELGVKKSQGYRMIQHAEAIINTKYNGDFHAVPQLTNNSPYGEKDKSSDKSDGHYSDYMLRPIYPFEKEIQQKITATVERNAEKAGRKPTAEDFRKEAEKHMLKEEPDHDRLILKAEREAIRTIKELGRQIQHIRKYNQSETRERAIENIAESIDSLRKSIKVK